MASFDFCFYTPLWFSFLFFHSAHIKLCYVFFFASRSHPAASSLGDAREPEPSSSSISGKVYGDIPGRRKKISCGTPTTCVFVCGGGVGAAAAVSPTSNNNKQMNILCYGGSGGIVRVKKAKLKKRCSTCWNGEHIPGIRTREEL